MGNADTSFVRYKSRHSVTFTLLNAQRLHEHPCATSFGSPLIGRTALVVGAGHSLTRNGHLLVEAVKLSIPIIAVNSSDVVLRSLGVDPDVVVVRESIDNSDMITASRAPVIVADIAAHPKVWSAAGDRLAWFIAGYPHTIGLAHRLGVAPVFGGSAAFTSAVDLARSWGARRIVLVGADLAMTPDVDGWLCYHPNAPRGDLRGVIVGDKLHMSGNGEDDARCVASGQRPQPKIVSFDRVATQDWGERRPILDTLLDQKRWLEIQAERHGANVELINATAGGAGIVGWRQERLEDVLEDEEDLGFAWELDTAPAPRVSAELVRQIVADIATEADKQRDLCEEMLRPEGPRLRQLVLGHSPLAESLAAWRIVDAPGTPLEACVHVYDSMRSAAGEALGILRGGGTGS